MTLNDMKKAKSEKNKLIKLYNKHYNNEINKTGYLIINQYAMIHFTNLALKDLFKKEFHISYDEACEIFS